MKIILTGASGFLGSALATYWGGQGHELLALTRAGSSLRRLASAGVDVTAVVSETPEAIADAFAAFSPDAIVHTACSYGRAGESALQVFQANVGLGMSLAQAVLESDKQTLFINTGTVLSSDVNLYALSKNQFSAWGTRLAAAKPNRMKFVDVRLQHMYGPGDDSSKFITHVLRSCRSNVPELKLAPGTQRRDFIFIDDVVAAYDTLLRQSLSMGATEAVEVGSGLAPPVREVVEAIHRITHSSTHLTFGAVEYRQDEAMLFKADINRMAELGWNPAYSLEAGLQETIRREFGQ